MSSLDATLPPGEPSAATDPGNGTPAVGGRYTLLAEVGRGAMGQVWRAYDSRLDRTIALKLLKPGVTSNAMLLEARALARVSHPNVVTVHDADELDGRAFIAMEFIEGLTLRQWQTRTPRAPRAVIEQYRLVARGLAAVHAAGLVHRDIKPENIMVAADGRPVVMDFGVAKVGTDADLQTGKDVAKLVGTPAYMSPEVFGGIPSTGQSDQFSFCVALYEALLGARPFEGETLWELSHRVSQGKRAPQPAGHTVPRAILAVLDRGLSHEPTERYSSMSALDQALGRATRRWPKFAAGLLGVSTASLGAVLFLRPPNLCEADAAALDAVWSIEKQGELRSAFEANGHPDALAISDAFEARTNAFVVDWRTENASLCEVDRPPVLLDAQRNCLRTQRAQLAALVETLGEPDRELVVLAPNAASRLPQPAWCTTARPGENVQEIYADTLIPVAREHAKAEALHALGRIDESRIHCEEALRLAEATGDPRGVGFSKLRLGRLAAARGDVEEAERWLEEASQSAARAGDDPTLAAVWVDRVFLALRDGRDTEAARTRLEAARLAVERSGSPPHLRGTLRNAEGQLLAASGRPDEALEAFREAVELAEEDPGEHPRANIASYLNNTGTMLARAGRAEESRRIFLQVIEIATEELGPANRTLATYRNNAANACMQLQDWGCALREFEQIERVLDGVEDSASPARASTHAGLGQVYLSLERYEEARHHAQAAVRLYEEELAQSNSRRLAAPFSVLSKTALRTNDPATALAWAERLIALDAELYPPGNPLVVEPVLLEARALQALERPLDALATLQTALKATDQPGPEGLLRTFEAHVLAGLGRGAAAISSAEQGLDLLQSAGNSTPHLVTLAEQTVGALRNGRPLPEFKAE